MTDKSKASTSLPTFFVKRLLMGIAILSTVLIYRYVQLRLPPLTEDRLQVADPIAGEHLLALAGCFNCHTDLYNHPQMLLAGGEAITTPFGDFYPPNITADPDAGIGKWTLDDFNQAVRRGMSPRGMPYYPAFPYVAYSGLSDQDIADMWAALNALPTYDKPSKNHDMSLPYSIRGAMFLWQAVYLNPSSSPASSPAMGIERGAYLANHVLHCAECHSPRNLLGAISADKKWTGGTLGFPKTTRAPDIRPNRLLVEGWTKDDLDLLLGYGMLPSGDFVGSYMSDITDITSFHLNAEDMDAINSYLLQP